MIFISYRKEDSAHLALSLAYKLAETFGETSVFLDRCTMEPGDHWREEVNNALLKTKVVLAVIGPRWLTITDEYGQRRIDRPDDILAYELSVALQRGIVVIPLYLQGLQPLPAKAFPSRLAGLVNQQGIEFDVANSLPNLLSRIEMLMRPPACQCDGLHAISENLRAVSKKVGEDRVPKIFSENVDKLRLLNHPSKSRIDKVHFLVSSPSSALPRGQRHRRL